MLSMMETSLFMTVIAPPPQSHSNLGFLNLSAELEIKEAFNILALVFISSKALPLLCFKPRKMESSTVNKLVLSTLLPPHPMNFKLPMRT